MGAKLAVDARNDQVASMNLAVLDTATLDQNALDQNAEAN